jgi:nucleoside 2-deoxyribosyltransferase
MPRELNERRPSYGTTIEIGWAIGLKKPIILVTDDAYLTEHPLIRANVNWVFEDFENAIDVIHGLFDDYVGNGYN